MYINENKYCFKPQRDANQNSRPPTSALYQKNGFYGARIKTFEVYEEKMEKRVNKSQKN